MQTLCKKKRDGSMGKLIECEVCGKIRREAFRVVTYTLDEEGELLERRQNKDICPECMAKVEKILKRKRRR